MLIASISWATGSFVSKRLQLPRDPFVAAAYQMGAGGIFLTLGALAVGEGGQLDGAAFTRDSVLAWIYLVVFGSLVGFTAYAWLLGSRPISLVVTHQYVNPLVAIALGMVFLDERPSPLALLGALVVLGAVYVAVRAEFPRKTRPATGAPRGTPASRTG